MISKTLTLALALSSFAAAAPTLKARQDACQDAYKSCVAAGTPEVACSCTLTACVGEDNARNREYCSSATANLATITSSAAATTYACNPAHSYPNGQSCVSTNGALSLVTPAPSASSTGYACNPAHSYPNSQTCISTNGALTLVSKTSAPTTTAAATSGYACNPAHSYPGSATCISTNGALSLVTPAPSAATTYACNPAHSYPNSQTCISTNGALTLVSKTSAPATNAPAPTATGQTSGTVAAGSNPTKLNKSWTVSDLTRYCGQDNSGCDYNFAVEHDGKTERCTVIRMPGSNAATESWSNQNCTTGSDLKISWGYVENPAPAYAVMTVVDGKELAWFGVSNVNGQKVTASNPFGSGEYGNITEPVYTY